MFLDLSAKNSTVPKSPEYTEIQGDQLNMAVLFWYFVKSYLSSVHTTHV